MRQVCFIYLYGCVVGRTRGKREKFTYGEMFSGGGCDGVLCFGEAFGAIGSCCVLVGGLLWSYAASGDGNLFAGV